MDPGMKKRGPQPLLFLWVGLIFLTGCAGTRVVETWMDPAMESFRLKKIAVLFIDPSQTQRRIGEDEIVRRLPPETAFPGYRIFPESEPVDFPRVSGRLREEGFDGAVLVRVLGVEDRRHWVPGYPAHSPPYRAYYFRGPVWYDSGYFRIDQLVRVEISVYFLSLNKLVWTGLTESFNPGSSQAMMAEVAEAVIEELRKQGRFLF